MVFKLKSWFYKKLKPQRITHTKKRKTFTKKKPKPLIVEQQGEKLGKLLCSLWKTQKDPSKVFVEGNRLHHGLFGLGLSVYGALENDDYVKGVGNALMKDDINDLPDWLNFRDDNRDTL